MAECTTALCIRACAQYMHAVCTAACCTICVSALAVHHFVRNSSLVLSATQAAGRLASQQQVAALIAEAQTAAIVKQPDEGKEFGRGKRCR